MKSHTKEQILVNNADSKMSQWVKLEDVKQLVKAANNLVKHYGGHTINCPASWWNDSQGKCNCGHDKNLTTYTKLKQELDL